MDLGSRFIAENYKSGENKTFKQSQESQEMDNGDNETIDEESAELSIARMLQEGFTFPQMAVKLGMSVLDVKRISIKEV